MATFNFYTRINSDDTWVLQAGNMFINTLFLSKTLDKSLDNSSFKFSSYTLIENIKPFTQCKLVFVDTATTTEYWYCTSKCNINVATEKAEHTVRLIEPTKMLEKMQKCEGLSFRRTLNDSNIDSIKDVIVRLNTIHKKYTDSDTDLFVLEATLATYLDTIKAPEFEFETGKTMLECLIEVGDFINAMPRLGGEDFNELTFDYYNKQIGDYDIGTFNIVNYDQSEEDYCNEAGDDFDNVYADDDNTNIINYPYVGGYITPRSKTIEIDNDTAVLVMPSDIYKKNKLYANYYKYSGITFSANLAGLDSDGFTNETTLTGYVLTSADNPVALQPLDIADYLLEKNDYDILTAKGAGSKEYNIYYTQNDKYIDGLTYSTNFVFGVAGDRAIINILQDADIKPAGQYAIDFINDNLDSAAQGGIVDLLSATITAWSATVLKSQDLFELLFNVQYQTNSSGRLQSVKDNYSDFSNTGNHISNTIGQGSKSANLIAIGRSNWANTQKLGNQYKQILIKIDKYSDLPILNSRIGDYVLTRTDIQFNSNTAIHVMLYLDKKFNRLNEYIDIYKPYRTWDVVRGKFIRRRTLDSEYVVVGSKKSYDIAYTNTSEAFKDDVTGIFGFETGDYSTPRSISSCELNNIGVKVNTIPVDSLAFGKAIKFTVKTFDNVSAGLYSEAVPTTSAYRANRQSIYTDVYGRVPDLQAAFYRKGNAFSGMSQLERIAAGQLLPNTTETSGTAVFSYTDNDYDKSVGEATELTKQFHFMPENSNYIVGFGLAELNPTIYESTTAPDLYLYYCRDKISDMTISIKEFSTRSLRSIVARTLITKTLIPNTGGSIYAKDMAQVAVALPTVFGLSFADQTTYKSWVLTDTNGLIILGTNKPTTTTAITSVVFNFTNKL